MLRSIIFQKKLISSIKESLSSVAPITIIVLALNFTIAPMPFAVRGLFLIGSALLIVGMGLFTLGADMAMMPMGEYLGSYLTRSKKVILMLVVAFAMGTMVTMAEPDLQVLAGLAPSIPANVLVITVALGVGVFLMAAMIRIVFQLKLSYMLIVFYGLVFALSVFVPDDFMPIAYDSGGVTTGPITVPFILAFGVGISSVRGGKSSHDDSFGLVALCSIGPIMAVMLLGIFYKPDSAEAAATAMTSASSIAELFMLFKAGFPVYFKEVGIALLPIILVFLLFQVTVLRLPPAQLIKIFVGIIYTYMGLVLFLTGVNIGFSPAGSFIGEYIGSISYSWVLIPIGLILGYFIVAAEPAVLVLNDQVKDITGGAISKNALLIALSAGVSISVGLAMCRILTGIDILFFLLPGYALALALTFFVPRIFSAIAFDSGGVASGAMTATFLLPFAIGASSSSGGSVMRDAFGLVALIAMTPIITIQIMGLIYKFKMGKSAEAEVLEVQSDMEEEADFVVWQSDDIHTDYYYPFAALADADTEFLASPEWLDKLQDEKLRDMMDDNAYIDFDSSSLLIQAQDVAHGGDGSGPGGSGNAGDDGSGPGGDNGEAGSGPPGGGSDSSDGANSSGSDPPSVGDDGSGTDKGGDPPSVGSGDIGSDGGGSDKGGSGGSGSDKGGSSDGGTDSSGGGPAGSTNDNISDRT
ncbi:MAG: DUF1538 domain-containing protein [Clostridiales Family XIII bacterium]|nr:DUF1538 domain-containing protein [Clostridiales Family XIII bacterium]